MNWIQTLVVVVVVVVVVVEVVVVVVVVVEVVVVVVVVVEVVVEVEDVVEGVVEVEDVEVAAEEEAFVLKDGWVLELLATVEVKALEVFDSFAVDDVDIREELAFVERLVCPNW
jgi:hypothetical protein